MRTVFCLMMGTAALFLAACTRTSPATPDTRESDSKAIRDGEDAWNKDWAAKDADKILAHYADDAKLMTPNVPLASSKSEIAPVLKQVLSDPNMALSFSASEVEVSKSGDLAYTRGSYSMTTSDEKTKKPVVEKGKYVTIYRKGADGAWKAVQDINNADAPAAPAGK